MHVASRAREHQVAMFQPQLLGARNPQPNRLWTRSRLQHEVILQLPLVAVVNKVDAGIDSFVLHLRVSRNVRPPLRRITANEVVTRAREFVRASNLGGGVGIVQLHAQHGAGRAFGDWAGLRFRRRGKPRLYGELGLRFSRGISRAQREHGFVSREKKRVARSARTKLYLAIGLPMIRFEAQRQLAITVENPGLSLRVGRGIHRGHRARRRNRCA